MFRRSGHDGYELIGLIENLATWSCFQMILSYTNNDALIKSKFLFPCVVLTTLTQNYEYHTTRRILMLFSARVQC